MPRDLARCKNINAGCEREMAARRLRRRQRLLPVQTGSKLRFDRALRVCHWSQINMQTSSFTSSLAKHPTKHRNLVEFSDSTSQEKRVLEIPQGTQANTFMLGTGMLLHLHRPLQLFGPLGPLSISLSVPLSLCVCLCVVASASLCACALVCLGICVSVRRECVYVNVRVLPCGSLCLCVFVCVCLCLCLCLCVSVCPCLCLCLWTWACGCLLRWPWLRQGQNLRATMALGVWMLSALAVAAAKTTPLSNK